MRDTSQLSVPKWPFFLGDAILLGLAYFIYTQGRLPLGPWEIAAVCLCVALGALLGVAPFVLDYRMLNKALEAEALGTATEKIQNLEKLAAQIFSATNHWQNVQIQSEKISVAAKELTERMAAEVRDFTDFLQKANESERATLRLEVEKLRRAEGDWLQVLVHVLDHVYALHAGATRSGQPRLIEQLTHFQNACRDAARRVGLAPFAPAAGEAFDSKSHQWADGDAPPAGAIVTEASMPGYTFQGRLVRPALVRAAQSPATDVPADSIPPADSSQDQLPLEVTQPPSPP